MFEPQGAGFFLLLMVVFGGLLVWVALARQLVFRVLAEECGALLRDFFAARRTSE